MGLLDDAIREHLELKRRHGADPSEVARQEQEALGPARRGPEPLEVPASQTPDEPAEAEPAAAEPAPAEPGAEAMGDPALVEPEVDAPVYHEPDEPHGAVAMGDVVPEPAAEAPAPPVTPERSEAAPPEDDDGGDAGQPTVAFDAADIAEAQRRPSREPEAPTGPEEDEDVLEETPDFLQETPEHDRLWFEQRPPRDFDFDG
ncbi:MAG TPA: hypothetical protein VFR97_00035 [Capillimicrobium sp.]|nr:hypothetical protein [Capillimicrobium sp.]